MVAEQDTRLRILAAAKGVLLDAGYANLSTRGIAEAAGVPLSQIHYHFGSKQKLDARGAGHGEPDAACPAGGDVSSPTSRCGSSGCRPATSSTTTLSRAMCGC